MLTHTVCGEWIQACQCPPEAVSTEDRLAYWNDRHAELGESAVLRRGDSPEDMAAFTACHVELLLQEIGRYAPAPARVFEFGCGWGRLLGPLAARDYRTWGCELADGPRERARERGLIVHDGLSHVPDGWADVVFTFTCLQHVSDELLPFVVAELQRITRPGGLVLLVENATAGESGIPWTIFRSVETYAALFPAPAWEWTSNDLDVGFRNDQRHSLMLFRRRP